MASLVDWGYAADFVDAFQTIPGQGEAQDYTVATGELYSVAEFVDEVFGYCGRDAERHIIVNRELLSRKPVTRVGNVQKFRDLTDWRSSYSFRLFVQKLVEDHVSFMKLGEFEGN